MAFVALVVSVGVVGGARIVRPDDAFAAQLPVRPATVAAGAGDIVRCDTSFTFTLTTNTAGNVVSVAVGDIAPACAGGVLRVALTDASGTAVTAGGPVTVAGSSATVTLSPAVPPSSVTTARAIVIGP